MTTAVKICGLRTEAALDAALAGGADYVGLVFYPRSPRHVDLETARALADRARGKAKVVALAVNPDDASLDLIAGAVSPDFIQLHGHESVERVGEVKARFGGGVIKAVAVATLADVERALSYAEVTDILLFDAKAPDGPAALPGGNGAAFDWRLLDGVGHRTPFMLSGGLTPGTVAEAIKVTGASVVDVSSGVETAPGEKDPGLIRQFLRAAKAVRLPD